MSSLFHLSKDKDFKLENTSSSLPFNIFLCTDAHLPHKKTPKLIEHHVGKVEPHSPHLFAFSGAFRRSLNSFSIFGFLDFLIFSFDLPLLNLAILLRLVYPKLECLSSFLPLLYFTPRNFSNKIWTGNDERVTGEQTVITMSIDQITCSSEEFRALQGVLLAN